MPMAAKLYLLSGMMIDHLGQPVYSEDDIFQMIMQGHMDLLSRPFLVEQDVDFSRCADMLTLIPNVLQYQPSSETLSEFDARCQCRWLMPSQYMNMDVAEHVLSLCTSSAELQRCGHELLMYQERDMFDLLRYLKYLVDVMRENNIIWGVGRGSSVASFVLYKLGVHRIDSLYYDLDIAEFLR